MLPNNRGPAFKGGYLPLNEKDVGRRGKIFCVLPFERLAKVTVALPLIAFIFCVIWSVTFHFETTVSTHCRVNMHILKYINHYFYLRVFNIFL